MGVQCPVWLTDRAFLRRDRVRLRGLLLVPKSGIAFGDGGQAVDDGHSPRHQPVHDLSGRPHDPIEFQPEEILRQLLRYDRNRF